VAGRFDRDFEGGATCPVSQAFWSERFGPGATVATDDMVQGDNMARANP
jgi:hypothetical protein